MERAFEYWRRKAQYWMEGADSASVALYRGNDYKRIPCNSQGWVISAQNSISVRRGRISVRRMTSTKIGCAANSILKHGIRRLQYTSTRVPDSGPSSLLSIILCGGGSATVLAGVSIKRIE